MLIKNSEIKRPSGKNTASVVAREYLRGLGLIGTTEVVGHLRPRRQRAREVLVELQIGGDDNGSRRFHRFIEIARTDARPQPFLGLG